MRDRHRLTTLVLMISGCLALPAFGSGVIADGDAIFEFKDSTTPGLCDFMPDGVAGGDYMFQNWWWIYAGDVLPISWPPNSEDYTGNTATLSGSNGPFIWTLTLELTDGATPGEAVLAETLLVANGTPQTSPLHMYAYSDIDAGGTYGGDEAILESDNILVTDVATAEYAELTYGASTIAGVTTAYQVGEFSDIRDLLSGGSVVTLDNSGLPFGPGDFTGAFQWGTMLLGGWNAEFHRTTTLGVPEPGTLALLLAGVTVTVLRRRS